MVIRTSQILANSFFYALVINYFATPQQVNIFATAKYLAEAHAESGKRQTNFSHIIKF